MFGTAATALNSSVILSPVGAVFTTMATSTGTDSLVPGPASNSIIGKTESSSEHIDGN